MLAENIKCVILNIKTLPFGIVRVDITDQRGFMKELIDSYAELLELEKMWGFVPFVINVGPELYRSIERTKIFNPNYFRLNTTLENDEYLEMPSES